jgi:F-type H+-transporting ATPase subunit b
MFLVLVGILNGMFFKPIVKYLDNRKNTLQNDMQSASANLSDINMYDREANEAIVDAKKEANKVLESAIKEAKSIATAKIEAKKSELATLTDEFIKDLSKRENALRGQLSQEIPLYSNMVKEKLLNKGA